MDGCVVEQVTPPFCNVCRIKKTLVLSLWSGGHCLTYGVETVAYISAECRHPQEEAPHEPTRWREPQRMVFGKSEPQDVQKSRGDPHLEKARIG